MTVLAVAIPIAGPVLAVVGWVALAVSAWLDCALAAPSEPDAGKGGV